MIARVLALARRRGPAGRPRSSRLRPLMAILAIALLLGGTALAASYTLARSSAAPAWVQTATQRLSKLETKSAASMSGYSRARFGPAWYDVDLNGCDTRNDILAHDLREIVFKAGSSCIVARGTLEDRYTATTISFVRGTGTSSKVQIDHVVALAAAWRTGAKLWSADRRLFYANDGVVLLAVDGPTNGAKSDKDAAAWLPPNTGFHCRYVARQVAIKSQVRALGHPARADDDERCSERLLMPGAGETRDLRHVRRSL